MKTLTNFLLSTLLALSLFIVLWINIYGCSDSNSSEEIRHIKVDVKLEPVKEEISEEELPIRNCDPTPTSISKVLSTELTQRAAIETKASLKGSVGFPLPVSIKASIEAEVMRSYSNVYESSQKQIQKMDKEIAPWTITTIKFRTKEQTFTSNVTFTKKGKTYQVPYQYNLKTPSMIIDISSVQCAGEPKYIDINPRQKTIDVGETANFRAVLYDSRRIRINQKDFFWASSNNNVATVSQEGIVQGRGKGRAKITATIYDIEATADITVKEQVVRISIEPAVTEMVFNGSIRLTPKVTDENGNRLDIPITWKSSDERIVYVDKKGFAEARWTGSATVTAVCKDAKATSRITVKPPQTSFRGKRIEIICPYPVGGTVYPLSAALSKNLEKILGTKIDVSLDSGWARAASSNPDGYTLAVYGNRLPANGNPGLDDFEPIAMFIQGYGLIAPKGTRKSRVAALEVAVKKAVESDEFKGFADSIKQVPHFVGSLDFYREVRQ